MTRRMSAVCLFVLGWSVGCSWLTKPEQGDIHCRPTDDDEGKRVDPCPDGTYCTESRICRPEPDKCSEQIERCKDDVDNDCDGYVDEPNEPDTERCDGEDNDCDGETDENFDKDEDDWSLCGDEATFEAGTFDCDPDRKEVNPDAPEVCDNLDNDCDRLVDEKSDPPLCPGTQACLNGRCAEPTCAEPSSGIVCKINERCIDARCVVQTCSPACKPNEVCDTTSHTCVAQPLKKSGEGCVADSDCEQAAVKLLCVDRAALGPLLAGATRGICTSACCSDTDCGTGESCYVPGTGARVCVPKTLVANPATPLRCVAYESCTPSRQTCAAGLLGDVATTICRTPTTNTNTEKKFGDRCDQAGDCASKLCVEGNAIMKVCSAPCKDSSDCMGLTKDLFTFTPVTPYCKYLNLGSSDAKLRGTFAPVCAVGRVGEEIGTGRNGQQCFYNLECASGVCMGGSAEGRARCSQTCCSDLQCMQAAPDVAPTRCQPVARGGTTGTPSFEMRCLVR